MIQCQANGVRAAAIIIAASNAASIKVSLVRHFHHSSPLLQLSFKMVLTYGTGGATAALTVVGLCMYNVDVDVGNS